MNILQLLVSLAIIGLILIQERSSGFSALLGGDGSVYQTRRGIQKSAFYATIVFSIVFVGLAIYQLFH
ncbi:MAG: preprotein translocase subunit SecG [Patescibacteria group bacterium]|nr:preprotein translocase subunit SecG [Patescibacteria group bacterium]